MKDQLHRQRQYKNQGIGLILGISVQHNYHSLIHLLIGYRERTPPSYNFKITVFFTLLKILNFSFEAFSWMITADVIEIYIIGSSKLNHCKL